jgi:hypothetical protein
MRHKYPRTPHMPFSPGTTKDDRVLRTLDAFVGREVVCSWKMDGENTTLYRHGFHARSVDSRHHVSRDWLSRFHAQIAHEIPEGWRICGENLYARHSIAYEALPSYFMGFSVWDARNVALSWVKTVEYLAELGITPVGEIPELSGVFTTATPAAIHRLVARMDTAKNEGIVMRLSGEIAYDDFGASVAKWVRKEHVSTSRHWMHAEVVRNGLA